MPFVLTESRVFSISSIWFMLVAEGVMYSDPTMRGSVFFSVCTCTITASGVDGCWSSCVIIVTLVAARTPPCPSGARV